MVAKRGHEQRLPTPVAAFEGSINRGYGSFRARNKQRCECGHERFHHMGFKEPGCSYLGTCPCRRFKRA